MNRQILEPRHYTVAWIAPLYIEARAALEMLDNRHEGEFSVDRGDDYVYYAGDIGRHNVVIATFPAGSQYGTASAASLAGQMKKAFPNLWFGLLVGVAAGLPNLKASRDIRLGDVLVGLPDGETAGLVSYDLGKETEDGFHPLRGGHALAMTETIVRSAIGKIQMESPNEGKLFLPHYERMKEVEHLRGTFQDPGQMVDRLFDAAGKIERKPRETSKRTRVWYGPIGSGEKLIKNAQIRDEYRDKHGLIGLEMEAAGTMNTIPVGVIRGVCDYGDKHKNKDWQPYAAAMAAAFGKAVLEVITPKQNLRDEALSQASELTSSECTIILSR
jgi:nucleoside phosphorylase